MQLLFEASNVLKCHVYCLEHAGGGDLLMYDAFMVAE